MTEQALFDSVRKESQVAAGATVAAAAIAAGLWFGKGEFAALMEKAEASGAVAEGIASKGVVLATKAGEVPGELSNAAQEYGTYGRFADYLRDSTSRTAIRLAQGEDPALLIKPRPEILPNRFDYPAYPLYDHPVYGGGTSSAAPHMRTIQDMIREDKFGVDLPMSWSWGRYQPAESTRELLARLSSNPSYLRAKTGL